MSTRQSWAKARIATLRRHALATSVVLSLSLLVTLACLLGAESEGFARKYPVHLRAQIEKIGEEYTEGYKRQEWFYLQRAYPLDEIPRGARTEALAQWD